MESSGNPRTTWQLIFVPALITLAITLLRLAGELEHWPAPWFRGGSAIVGISWLPFIFGPYFALKLARAGDGPPNAGKAIGFSVASLGILALGGYFVFRAREAISALDILGFLVLLGAAFVPGLGWRRLGRTLVAYAFAARIPVLVVIFLAFRANGGAGWGTHYDSTPARLASAGFWMKFVSEGLLPQMCGWVAYTVIVGAILGSIAAAVAHGSSAQRSPQPAAS